MLGSAAVVDSGSTIANEKIDTALAAINKNVEQFKLLIAFFKKKYPDFVKGYRINAKVGNAGVKHGGIEGVITIAATGQPAENAMVKLVGTNKMTDSSLTGTYQIIKVKTGIYKVEITGANGETKMVILKIPRGKVVKLDLSI